MSLPFYFIASFTFPVFKPDTNSRSAQMDESKSELFQPSLLSLSLQEHSEHLTSNTCFIDNRIITLVITDKHLGVSLDNSSHATRLML